MAPSGVRKALVFGARLLLGNLLVVTLGQSLISLEQWTHLSGFSSQGLCGLNEVSVKHRSRVKVS